jgi:hypothetical protein
MMDVFYKILHLKTFAGIVIIIESLLALLEQIGFWFIYGQSDYVSSFVA